MNKLFIDDRAIEFIRIALAKDNAPAMRLFIGGGGCCKQLEIIPVKKALSGDVTFIQDGIRVHVEKQIADKVESIEIVFDEQKGLLIYLNENQENLNIPYLNTGNIRNNSNKGEKK